MQLGYGAVLLGAFSLWIVVQFLHFGSLRAVSVMAVTVSCSGECIWVQETMPGQGVLTGDFGVWFPR